MLFKKGGRIARRAAIVGGAMSCAGCFGFLVDKPWTKDIRNPVPLTVDQAPISFNKDRWACQPPDPAVPLTKKDFLSAWGEPEEKLTTAAGETWVYRERGRWCGMWVSFIVPAPLLLPVCETYDRVEFEGELAVRSQSRRVDGYGMGVVFYYPLLPIPFKVGPAEATSGHPRVAHGKYIEESRYCRWPTSDDASPGQGQAEGAQTEEDLVNCLSGGERKSVPRSQCD